MEEGVSAACSGEEYRERTGMTAAEECWDDPDGSVREPRITKHPVPPEGRPCDEDGMKLAGLGDTDDRRCHCDEDGILTEKSARPHKKEFSHDEDEVKVSGGNVPENTVMGFPHDEDEVFRMNALTLAYIGDAVYELMVRRYMLETGSHQVDKLHRHTTAVVNAGAQSAIALGLIEELSEHELAVYKRGRNANTVTPAKHQRMGDYRRATGFEALFGYLYLTGRKERLEYIFMRSMEIKKRNDIQI